MSVIYWRWLHQWVHLLKITSPISAIYWRWLTNKCYLLKMTPMSAFYWRWLTNEWYLLKMTSSMSVIHWKWLQWVLSTEDDLRGIPFSAVTFEFSQCYYIVIRECHISPESLCRELSKFTHYFDLVAMAMLLALWLAKHGNGCSSKRKHRFDKIFGTNAK